MDEKLKTELENYKAILDRESQIQNERDGQEVDRLFQEMEDRVQAMPKGYQLLFNALADAVVLGDAYPEVPFWYSDAQMSQFVAACRKYGVDQFVFADNRAFALSGAWRYQQMGCRLESVVALNRHPESFGHVRPGLLFRVLLKP